MTKSQSYKHPSRGKRPGGDPSVSSGLFCLNKLYGQVSRAVSTGKLNVSLRLHTRPIKQVI